MHVGCDIKKTQEIYEIEITILCFELNTFVAITFWVDLGFLNCSVTQAK